MILTTIAIPVIELKSIKIIERTVIPVIKVATKDSRSKSLQLDISFDSPEHHGLEAVGMVKNIMEVSMQVTKL